jgi:methylthioribose-1-phosphate isomerase
VREMKTRAFGQVLTFLYSGALLASDYRGTEAAPLREQIAEMTEAFCAARPTFDFRALGAFFDERLANFDDGERVGEHIARQTRDFVTQIMHARRARAQRAASILPNPARVLTHCNMSGELVEVGRYCRELQKDFSVIATETRPYLQGARLTAWELAQAGLPATLIPDCAIAQVLASGEVNAVIVGADRSARNGDVINKVGTYPLALMAREYHVPFDALVQEPRSLERGVDVPIEERPAAEFLTFQGESISPVCDRFFGARYPSFDITPAGLITHLVGFDDIYTAESFRQRYGGSASPATERIHRAGKYILIYGIPPKSQCAFLLTALKAEKAESILVPEMRSALWGPQVVAPELLARRAPVTLISDNIMGTLFAQGEIGKLCLFYDRLTEQGPIGICGSLLAARLARLHCVEIEIFSSAEPQESARDRDVSTFLGKKICPPGVSVRTVEPEVIPWELLKN